MFINLYCFNTLKINLIIVNIRPNLKFYFEWFLHFAFFKKKYNLTNNLYFYKEEMRDTILYNKIYQHNIFLILNFNKNISK